MRGLGYRWETQPPSQTPADLLVGGGGQFPLFGGREVGAEWKVVDSFKH